MACPLGGQGVEVTFDFGKVRVQALPQTDLVLLSMSMGYEKRRGGARSFQIRHSWESEDQPGGIQ